MPNNQVSKFQMMAEPSAANATGMVIASPLTTSFPIVVATATPNKNGPTIFARAVMASAAFGGMAREAMAVATTLALS